MSVESLFIFYLANSLISFYTFRRISRQKNRSEISTQNIQEQINILNDQNAREHLRQGALQQKVRRYNRLKVIIEEINQSLDLDHVADKLAEVAFTLIAGSQGVCILYLVDEKTRRLNIFKTKKEQKDLIIKAKEGDIFDVWVLRHSSPLLVEDIKKDFRFDPDKLKSQDIRTVSSLISAPLISEHRLLGVLRVDNPKPNFYLQDDLRYLVNISDIGAVALENGELFQRTNDLAIHDSLTGLYTKGYFLQRLKEEYKRSNRQNRPLSLLMLDIDYFKKYNDKFGHTAGDIVLKSLSETLTRGLQDLSPLISRFGGEEFCVVFSGKDKAGALEIAELLRKTIKDTTINLRRHESSVTVSIGVAVFPEDAKDEDELILRADHALYAAKHKGRNRVCGL